MLLLEDSSTYIYRCFVFNFTIARTYNVVPACAGRRTLQACLITNVLYLREGECSLYDISCGGPFFCCGLIVFAAQAQGLANEFEVFSAGHS